MIPLSMESIFLLLSGVILAAGILYWFWSHIQLTQKKVQLLENAVFELRGMMGPGPPPAAPVSPSSGVSLSPVGPSSAPAPVYADLDDEEWGSEEKTEEVHPVSTPLDQLGQGGDAEDLEPGGRILAVEREEGEHSAEEFKEMFLHQQPTAPSTPESLESMPVKELRRLAEQRGIAGATDMRKKEILAALRKQIRPDQDDRVVELTESGAVVME